MIVMVSCQHFPDDERVYYRELISLKTLGLPLYYFTRSDSKLDMSDDLIIHKNFLAKNFSIKEYVELLKVEFKLLTPTILHFHEFYLLPLAKHVKYYYDTKTIYDVHEDLRFVGETFSRRNQLLRSLSIFIKTHKERYYIKFIDQVILINPIIKDCIFVDWGLNPVMLEGYPSYLSISDNLNNGCRGNTIIYHGHLGPERGIQELVESVIIIKKKFPNVLLILLGTFRYEEFEEYILNIINENKLSKNIKWIKQVPHKEVWSYLNKASIGLIPFKNNAITLNNTPTKLFEMMASGCGIIATDLPPIRYHVSDTIEWLDSPLPISIAEKVIKLFKKPTLLDQYANNNRRLIRENYNWELISYNLVDLYNNFLK